jgi:hypothetical protein
MKKLAALMLTAALLVGSAAALTPEEAFPNKNTYPGFIDVEAGAWYADPAKVCCEVGLMQGTGQAFAPLELLTVGEVAAIAARMNEAITGQPILMVDSTLPWYTSYVSYLESLDITVPDPTKQATRQEFVTLLSAVVPADMLSPINQITALPDTTDAQVLAFYNAGILTGVDAWGTFAPDKTLTRAECAAMVARIVRPALRESFTPEDYTIFTAAYLKPSDILFTTADKTVTAGQYLPYVIARIDGLEIACAENGEEFNWFNTLNGDETYLDYVKNGALDYFGVTRAQGTQLYQNFDVQVFYSRYLDLGGTVAQPNKNREYTLYVGQEGELVPFPTHSPLDPATESAILVDHFLNEMHDLTGWNLDVTEIYVGEGEEGVTISWADTSALFVGPPEPQKDGFHVYDSTQLAFTLLDSVQYTVQCAFSPENPQALDVYFHGPDGGALVLENLGVTLPADQPYSHILLEGLLSGEN